MKFNSNFRERAVKNFKYACLLALPVVLTGCLSTTPDVMSSGAGSSAGGSPPESLGERHQDTASIALDEKVNVPARKNIGSVVDVEALQPLSLQKLSIGSNLLPRDFFAASNDLAVAANEMPIKDFIHYVFGELLKVNYVLGASFGDGKHDSDLVTLSLADGLNSREVYDFVTDFLSRRNIDVTFDNEVFFIRSVSDQSASSPMVIGIGAQKSAVPKTAQRILQVVPLKFGIKISLERTLRSLVKAKITPDFEQSALFIEGRREEILQALDLVEMLDTPAMRGKFIGLIKLNYVSAENLTDRVSMLLKNEGIDIGIREPLQRNLVLVPLEQLNGVVIFATNEILLQRVIYWTELLDVPSRDLKEDYFIYSPRYARAVDLGKTLKELTTGMVATQESSSGRTGTGNAPDPSRSGAAVSDRLTMVVDEAANSLIFYTLGEEYQALLPLMRKLDVMPRQVMLDITIAEVTLKDEFKYGVEWAAQRGDVSLTTQGAFGATTIGGIGLSINGTEGPLDASFLASNSLVNILSNPSMLVKDGVSASISVGSDVSIVGATTQDPISGERQTTTSVYKKTGVDVSVTPTINAEGIVTMTITQNISNSVPGSAGSGGNPDIFSRTLNTEVVASSGQTVILGGLISEDESTGETGVPLFSKIPLLGGLFKSDSNTLSRTELIMLITPMVVEDIGQWDKVSEEFEDKLEYLKVK